MASRRGCRGRGNGVYAGDDGAGNPVGGVLLRVIAIGAGGNCGGE